MPRIAVAAALAALLAALLAGCAGPGTPVRAAPGADAGGAPAPDLIVRGARVTTQDDARPEAQAFAVREGLIVAVGGDAEIASLAGPGTLVVDADGRRVIPGLNDSHLHAVRGGRFYALELRWDGVNSLERALAMVAEQ